MGYDWEGRRTRGIRVLKFLSALAIPVLLLGSAIAAAEWANGQTFTIEATGTPAAPSPR